VERRPLGATSLTVSSICHGTGALGAAVDAPTAVETVRHSFASPIDFVDTSNQYGGGESERRIGEAIAAEGGVPQNVTVATKIDPAADSFDFSGDRARESVEESLLRLGLEHLPLVYLHDPERIPFEEGAGHGGPLEALLDLRDQGVIGHVGVATGSIDLALLYLDTGSLDVLLNHNRYTLVEQRADQLIDATVAAGVGFVNAAPFGGGLLAQGTDASSSYSYAPASAAALARVRAMERLCAAFDVPLAAAALQFSTRDPRIGSTVVGMTRPERIARVLELDELPIPQELWDELLPLAAVGREGIE